MAQRVPARASAKRRRAAAPVRALARGGGPGGRDRRRAQFRPAPRGAEPAEVPHPDRDGRAVLPRGARRKGRDRALRAARERARTRARGVRSTTSSGSSAALGFAGYFLTVWDITEFCRRENIYCQGRGSAANSAVCFSLGITNADAVKLNLFFERFLSPARDGPPDIDVDIESGRREEVIQYVFALRTSSRGPGGGRDHVPCALGVA